MAPLWSDSGEARIVSWFGGYSVCVPLLCALGAVLAAELADAGVVLAAEPHLGVLARIGRPGDPATTGSHADA
jgi:hypothetical protein